MDGMEDVPDMEVFMCSCGYKAGDCSAMGSGCDICGNAVSDDRVETIRIRTKTGRLIERKATIRDVMNGIGEFIPLAQVGIHVYRIVNYDSGGPVWHVA